MTPHRRPFEVGERIVCYDIFGRRTGKIIRFESNPQIMHVEVDDLIYSFHANQCRHLKKKEPLLDIWVNTYPSGWRDHFKTKEDADKSARPDRIRCVLLREVKSK